MFFLLRFCPFGRLAAILAIAICRACPVPRSRSPRWLWVPDLRANLERTEAIQLLQRHVDLEFLRNAAGQRIRTCVTCPLLSHFSLPLRLSAIFSIWSSFVRVCVLLSDSLLLNLIRLFFVLSRSLLYVPFAYLTPMFFFSIAFLYVAVVLCVCAMYNSVSLSVSLLRSVHVPMVVCVSVCCWNLCRIVSFSFINIAHVSSSYKYLSSVRRTIQDLQRHILHLWRTGPNWRRRYIARKRLERHCVPEGSCMCVASFTTCVCSVICFIAVGVVFHDCWFNIRNNVNNITVFTFLNCICIHIVQI